MRGYTPFNEKFKKVPDMVMAGKRPQLFEYMERSTDAYSLAMKKAMEMCWTQNPKERTGAREVANVLQEALKTLEIEQ